MKFVRADAETGAKALEQVLLQDLTMGRKVLWLVSGGSNVPISTQVMAAIPETLSENLTIILTDERYGPVGHANSNAQQLLDAGFSPKQGSFTPVLTSEALELTIQKYAKALEREFTKNDVVIAQFGIGADGHIAGILPNSLATQEQKALVCGYQASNFTRITLTFSALIHIDIAFVFAYGEAKQSALKQLQSKELSPKTQPAQILRQIPASYVYNDQIGGDNV